MGGGEVIKIGNYMNSLFYGNKVSTDWAKRGNLCHASEKRYISWMDIPQWIIRNLMVFGNCSLKRTFYVSTEKQFAFLFGEDNMIQKHSDFKDSMILEVTKEGRLKAKPFVEEEEDGTN